MYSPVCRYDVITSNNVEGINSRFQHVRRLPILELLMEVEKLVATDRASRFQHAIEWQTLTKFAFKCLRKSIDNAGLLNCQALSQFDFIIIA